MIRKDIIHKLFDAYRENRRQETFSKEKENYIVDTMIDEILGRNRGKEE